MAAWDLALDAGLLELADRQQAVAGPNYDAWPDGAPEDVLSVWLAAFASAAGLVEADAPPPQMSPCRTAA